MTADADPPPLPPFPVLRSGLMLTAVMAVAFIVATGMLGGLGPRQHLAPAIASGLVCYLAALAALVPVWRMSLTDPRRVPVAAFLAMGIRFGGSVLGVLGLLVIGRLAPIVTAGWTLGWYLLLLAVEVIILVRYLRQWSAAPSRDQTPRR